MRDKSDSRDIIHLHHEPFEEQEESMSLMVALKTFPPSMNIGKKEKGALDEENGEEKSTVPTSEIRSFVDVGSSPMYGSSYFIPPYLLSFNRNGYGHDRGMDMRYIDHTLVGTFFPNTWVHKEHVGRKERVIITLPNEESTTISLLVHMEKSSLEDTK
ncbi:hypothetical protein KI387_011093, partial [Taxus chinensis]